MDSADGLLALCEVCFKECRTAEGRIMGYKVVKGKTRQFVEEELFGDF